jgi:hypothetical protein
MENNLKFQGEADIIKPWEGRLSCNFFDKKGNLLEQRELGKNLVVNNAKLVLAHLMGQTPTTSVINGVQAFDPRISSPSVGRLNGGVPIVDAGWNPTPTQLAPLYMAFGSNLSGTETGANPGITQKGLFNAISKTGKESGLGSTETIASYLYGGKEGDNSFVIQYLPNADGVSDSWVRFITRIKTYQGQLAANGSQQEYREAGLFTTPFVTSTQVSPYEVAPIMIARKTFPTITKTYELELEFVWELRF